MFPTSRCFAGRIILRDDRLAGLDWRKPCPIPAEVELPTEIAMYFCVQHGQALAKELFDLFDEAGLIDHSIVAASLDDFDELMLRLGPLEGQ